MTPAFRRAANWLPQRPHKYAEYMLGDGSRASAAVLVVGVEPTRDFSRRLVRSLRLPVSPHQHSFRLRTVVTPKGKTRDPTRAADRGPTISRRAPIISSYFGCGARCVQRGGLRQHGLGECLSSPADIELDPHTPVQRVAGRTGERQAANRIQSVEMPSRERQSGQDRSAAEPRP